jgi:ribosomal protein L18
VVNKKIRKQIRNNRNSYNLKRINMNNQKLMRVLINRTERNIYAQLIDINGHTHKMIASNQKVFTERANKDQKSYNKQGAFLVGQILGEYMKSNNITKFVFDRSSFTYHGRVAQVCEGIKSIINNGEK